MVFVGEQLLRVAGTMECDDPGFVDPLQVPAPVVDALADRGRAAERGATHGPLGVVVGAGTDGA